MSGMKVFVLDHGFCGADANWFEAGINYATAFNRNPERMWKINCFYSILIQHPTEGNILFDTGLPSRERFPEWALATMEFEGLEPDVEVTEALAVRGGSVPDSEVQIREWVSAH